MNILLGCIFSTNFSTLGPFLPVAAGIILLSNICFGVIWWKGIRRKKNKKID